MPYSDDVDNGHIDKFGVLPLKYNDKDTSDVRGVLSVYHRAPASRKVP